MLQGALLLLGGIVAVVVAARVVGLVLVRRHVETLAFRGPVRAVEVSLASGEVTVRGNARGDARVRRTLRYGVRRPRVSEAVDDGVLRLAVPAGTVQYEIDVPAGAAVLVRGAAVSATVIGVTGAVALRAGAGSLEGRALGGDDVRAATDAGSIRLSFDSAPTSLDVATGDGSVDLALPDGPYDVDAACVAGSARVAVPTRSGARCRVRARSTAGSLRITPR